LEASIYKNLTLRMVIKIKTGCCHAELVSASVLR